MATAAVAAKAAAVLPECLHVGTFLSMPCGSVPGVSTLDKSVGILTQLLGPEVQHLAYNTPFQYIANTTQIKGMSLIPQTLSYFNSALLGAAIIIFAVLLFVGTINTAHEGQFLGKKWNSMWIPLRAIFGPLFVIPLKGGLCIAQVIILYAILVGVHMASIVWANSMKSVSVSGVVPTVPAYMSGIVKSVVGQVFLAQSANQLFINEGLGSNSHTTKVIISGSQPYTPQTYPSYKAIVLATGQLLCHGSSSIRTQSVFGGFNSSYCSSFMSQLSGNIAVGTGDGTSYANKTGYLYTSTTSGANKAAAFPSGAIVSANLMSTLQTPYSISDNGDAGWGGGWPFMGVVNTATVSPLSLNVDGDVQNVPPFTGSSAGGFATYPTGFAGTHIGFQLTVKTQLNAYQMNPAAYYTINPNLSSDSDDPSGVYFVNSNGSLTFQNNFTVPSYFNATLYGPKKKNGQSVSQTPIIPLSSFVINNVIIAGVEQGPTNSSPITMACGGQDYATTHVFTSPSACTLTPYIDEFNYNVAHRQGVNWLKIGPKDKAPPIITPVSSNIFTYYAASTGDGSKNINVNSVITSWWSAGTSYLALNRLLAQNLSKLNTSIQDQAMALLPTGGFNIKSSSIVNTSTLFVQAFEHGTWNPSFAVSANAKFTMPSAIGILEHITSLGSYITNSFQITSSSLTNSGGPICSSDVGVSGLNISAFINPPSIFADFGLPFIIGYSRGSGGPITSSQVATLAPIKLVNVGPSNLNVTVTPSIIKCNTGHVPGDVISLGMQWKTPKAVPPASWNSFFSGSSAIVPLAPPPSGHVTPASPYAPFAIGISANQNFLYQTLLTMPVAYQPYFASMFRVFQNDPKIPQPFKLEPDQRNGIYVSIYNMVLVLAANGLIPTPGSGNDQNNLPVVSVMTKIFSGLLGSSGGAETTGFTSVMNQIYDIGVAPKDNVDTNLTAAQANLIQQTELVGLNTILDVVNSMSQIFTHFKQKFQHVEVVTTAMAVTTAVAATAASFIPFQSGAGSAVATLGSTAIQLYVLFAITGILYSLMWLPLVIFVLTSLFAIGINFAILVPLTPYILFWAGQIAWMLGVLEAMVAAPILMLGLAHPGGHDMLGHALPGVKMALAVIFRPVLMVIGLIVGIALTYIVLNFSAAGFHAVAYSILQVVPEPAKGAIQGPVNFSLIRGILATILLFIYSSFIVMAFTACFKTIYVIPEKVMQWIGGQADKAGAEELQKMSQTTSQSSQGAAQAGGSSLDKGMSAGQKSAEGTGSAAGSGAGGFGAGGDAAKRGADAKSSSKKSGDQDVQA